MHDSKCYKLGDHFCVLKLYIKNYLLQLRDILLLLFKSASN